MKKLLPSVLIAFPVILLQISAVAQGDRFSRNRLYVKLGNEINWPVKNIESNAENGKTSIELITSLGLSGEALRYLYKRCESSEYFLLKVSVLSAQSKLIQQTDHLRATVTEFAFPLLHIDSSTSSDIKVQLEADIGKIGSKDPVPQVQQVQKAILSRNFRITLGDLPTNGVRSISPIVLTREIIKSNGAVKVFFSIEISGGVTDWQTWLQKKGSKTGVIELRSPNLREVMFKFNLKEVEIVSINTSLNTASKSSTIRLAAKTVTFESL